MEKIGLNLKVDTENNLDINPKTRFKNSSITVEGKGNSIIIDYCRTIQNLNVHFKGNYKTLYINASNKKIRNLKIVSNRGDEQQILIGEEFGCGGVEIQANDGFENISIGKDCLFSWGIKIRSSDGHTIIDGETGLVSNLPSDILIEDHVWVSENVSILKGSKILRNSVVSHSAVVTKKFEENSVIIGGVPAKVLKRNINWDRENPVLYDKRYDKSIIKSFFYKGDKLTQDALLKNWEFDYVSRIEKGYLLFLKNITNSKFAWWIFDENRRYIANEINKSVLKKYRDGFFTLLFIKKKMDLSVSDFIDLYEAASLDEKCEGGLRRNNISYKELCEIVTERSKKLNESIYTFLKCFYISSYLQVFLIRVDDKYYLLFAEGYHYPNITVEYEFGSGFTYFANEESVILISKFFQHIKRNKQYINNYLSEPSSLSLLIKNTHIGHLLWNDLSAIENNKVALGGRNISRIFVHSKSEHDIWGMIENFSFTPENAVFESLKSEAFNNRYSDAMDVVRLSDYQISPELVDEIINSFSDSAKNDIEEVEFVSKVKPLKVAIGLRFENRTWINQTEGIIDLIGIICESSHIPHIQIIIDGHDINPYHNVSIRSHLEKDSVVELEKETFKKIAEELESGVLKKYNSRLSLIDLVNKKLDSTITILNSCDFFIAPWGAGLVKYKWICNLPGIVFSTKEVLSKPDANIYDSPEIRSDIKPSRYLDTRFVKLVEGAESAVPIPGSTRSNFIVDVNGFKPMLSEILQSEKYDNN